MTAELNYITGFPGFNTTAYVTCRTWSADSESIFVETDSSAPGDKQILQVNISTLESRHLATIATEDESLYEYPEIDKTSVYHFDYAPGAGVIVYFDILAHNLYLLDVKAGESKRVLHEDKGNIHCPPSITADGTRVVYTVLYPSIPNKHFGPFTSVLFSLDLDPVKLEPVGEPQIITVYPARLVEKAFYKMPKGIFMNHPQVNPKNRDHFCYSHEFRGVPPDGSLVLIRCWQNIDGLDKPVYRPQVGEWQTHEIIGSSGKNLYFVDTLGVSSVDFETGERRKIYEFDGVYNPSHISVSPDEKWICADLLIESELDENDCYESGLMLIDVETGEYECLCRFKRGRSHPRHPHPIFSPDGKKIAFTVADGPYSQVAYVVVN